MMATRFSALFLAAALAACAAPGGSRVFATSTLTPADAATNLIAGGTLTTALSTPGQVEEGMDPVVTLTLTRADGAVMQFQQANHASSDLQAQAPAGPLAQVMGLFGEESPQLYHRVGEQPPFICGAEGPTSIGFYQAEDGAVSIVGLKSGFEFETLSDGTTAALPFSPDLVCARLRFTAG